MVRQLEHHEISKNLTHVFNVKIILVLCGLEKTQNVGMILRSAAINGVEEVVLLDSLVYPSQKLKKISRNAQKFLNIKYMNGLESIEENYSHKDFSWIALEYTNESIGVENYKEKRDVVLFIGNEKDGVPQEVLQKTDVHLHLNMYGNISSYNVAIATSIALYQMRLGFNR